MPHKKTQTNPRCLSHLDYSVSLIQIIQSRNLTKQNYTHSTYDTMSRNSSAQLNSSLIRRKSSSSESFDGMVETQSEETTPASHWHHELNLLFTYKKMKAFYKVSQNPDVY